MNSINSIMLLGYKQTCCYIGSNYINQESAIQVNFFNIGGGFDLDQAVVGQLGDFSMWDREMSATELNSIGCDKTGVISSLPTMMVRGERKFSEQKLPNCNRK